MATRTERRKGMLSGSIFGSFAGIYGGLNYPMELRDLPAYGEFPAWILLGALVGLFLGRWLAQKLGLPDDTVVYTLRRRGRIVYVGIAYKYRVEGRIAEHRRTGKRFDRVDISRARPRKEALNREANRIRRFQPKYNVLHKGQSG